SPTRGEGVTCHPERRIDLRVSASHDTETLKRVQGDIESCYKTLSRICKFAHCSLTNSTLSQRERVKQGFTLAEVLITLGIIGIVAAMTLPALIQNHRRQVVESRLKKFYSISNQAVAMAETEYGDKKGWDIQGTDDFFDKYISKYLNIASTEEFEMGNRNCKIYNFTDGSAVLTYALKNSVDGGNEGCFNFCPKARDCSKADSFATLNSRSPGGKTRFWFCFYPNRNYEYHANKGVEPYKAWWNGQEEQLYTKPLYGCRKDGSGEYCAALIQFNGWKIPKDYPFRF
ncbi:type II secretion system protein, partial [bacterium]|nr:type II secretion system protein [bacterium]